MQPDRPKNASYYCNETNANEIRDKYCHVDFIMLNIKNLVFPVDNNLLFKRTFFLPERELKYQMSAFCINYLDMNDEWNNYCLTNNKSLYLANDRNEGAVTK